MLCDACEAWRRDGLFAKFANQPRPRFHGQFGNVQWPNEERKVSELMGNPDCTFCKFLCEALSRAWEYELPTSATISVYEQVYGWSMDNSNAFEVTRLILGIRGRTVEGRDN